MYVTDRNLIDKICEIRKILQEIRDDFRNIKKDISDIKFDIRKPRKDR